MAATLVHTSTAHSSREAKRAGRAFAAMAALADARRWEREREALACEAARHTVALIEQDGPDATYGAKIYSDNTGKYRVRGLFASDLAWYLADPDASVDAWVESTGEAI